MPCGIGEALRKEASLQSRPRGEKFVQRSQMALEKARGSAEEAKRALVEAQQDLEMTQQSLDAAKPNSKEAKQYEMLFAAAAAVKNAEQAMQDSRQ